MLSEQVYQTAADYYWRSVDRGEAAWVGAAYWAARVADGEGSMSLSMHRIPREVEIVVELNGDRTREEEAAEHARLLRDIFGNPFRPTAFDLSWRTATAVGLARALYDSRDFAAMPVLADALEDAGCDNADVLSHCRGLGPHVRGCWVVDLVLGKS